MALFVKNAISRLPKQLGFIELSKYQHNVNIQILQVRRLQYPPTFIDPVTKPENQDALKEEGQFETLMYCPVKAAKSDDTSLTYDDEQLKKFTNMVMMGGDKKVGRKIINRSFEIIKRTQLEKLNISKTEGSTKEIECNPNLIFHRALENCKPIAELTPIKRGGITYQVPVPILPKRSQFLGMKWLIEAVRNRSDKTSKNLFPKQLAKELLDAHQNRGQVVKRKQDLHVQCETNKAFAHYRW